jgi:hypothetical protein
METATTERIDADLSTPDVPIRMLATGGNADERYPVPSKQAFKSAGEGVVEADDLERIADALIADDALPLGHLAALRIGYLWADRGGSAGGFPCFGRLIKASKALLHYAEIDYLVMLSADHLRDAKATRWQVEALVGHQLGHIEMLTTEKGEDRYSVKGHDFEGFAFEFRRWGAYLPGMVAPAQSAASAVQSMVWEAGEDDDDGEDFDPSIDRAPGVDDEAGPVPGGSPDAEWADGYDPSEADFGQSAEAVPSAEQAQAEDEDWQRAELVRTNFGTTTAEDGAEVCRRCGVGVFDHDPELCTGGAPRTTANHKRGKRSAANGTAPESQAETGAETLSDRYSASNGNGGHDPNAGDLLIDPDRVMALLTEQGRPIAYQELPDGTRGYLNPSTGERYSTAWVEGEFRAALAGRRS